MICVAVLDREALVTDNMGLVYHWAARLVRANGRVKALGLDDAQGVGFLSLVKAAKRFDPDLGYQFCTFATSCIRRGIKQAADRAWLHKDCSGLDSIEARPNALEPEDEQFWSLVYRDCSPTERRVVRQHYQQGLTMREIAVQSPKGKSYQAASLAHRRALKKAGKLLKSHPEYKKLIDPV